MAAGFCICIIPYAYGKITVSVDLLIRRGDMAGSGHFCSSAVNAVRFFVRSASMRKFCDHI